MTIQFNTDRNLTMHESFAEKLSTELKNQLDRFGDFITRLEVHLADENGQKQGINDKSCTLEARLAGRQPIAVSQLANTHEQAVSGAVKKLKASLDTIVGRLQNH